MIPKLKEMLTWYDGSILYQPYHHVALQTSEGSSAVLDLISFLETQQPLEPLQWHSELM